jgi:riboflavin kinase/FMN adenylyltransferase
MTPLIKASSVDDLSVRSAAELAVTVGNFDGVHRGHQAVLAELRRVVSESGRKGVVVTFDPHPLSVLAPESAPGLLTPLEERFELIEAAGIAAVLVVPFTLELATRDGRTFLDGVGVGAGSHVVLGYDFHMGRDRSSGIDALRVLGRSVGFDLDVVPPVLFEGEPISSSRIRSAVERGDMQAARRMLGRPYVVRGDVVRGDGIGGKTLGTPTANIRTPSLKLLPKDGVYYVEEVGRGTPGVLYVGRRPTIGAGERRCEVHLLDLELDLYGKELGVAVLERIRGERQFADLPDLAAQISKDVRRARRVSEERGM